MDQKAGGYEELAARLEAAEVELACLREHEQLHAAAVAREGHLRKVLGALRDVNRLIVHEEDPRQLIQKACECLTGGLGYNSAWIAIAGPGVADLMGLDRADFDAAGNLMATGSCGVPGGKFSQLCEKLTGGRLPHCISQALAGGGASVVLDPRSNCADCPLVQEYSERAGMARVLDYDGQQYGYLVVSVSREYADDPEEQTLFSEVAEDVSFALHRIASRLARKRADTALQQAERKFHEGEAKLRALLDSMEDLVFVLDENLVFQDYRTPSSEKLEIPPEMLLGRKVDDIPLPSHALDAVVNAVRETAESGRSSRAEYWLDMERGRFWYDLCATPIRDLDGRPSGIACVIRDITNLKLAELALQAKSEELELYFTSTLDLLCIADASGVFLRLNPEWSVLLGYPLEELLGVPFLNFVHPDDVAATLQVMEELYGEHEIRGFENRYRCRDGSWRWIEWRTKPIGRTWYATARDVTQRHLDQEALQREIHLRDLLMRISEAFFGVTSSGLDGAIASALAIMGEFSGADRAYLFDYTLSDGASKKNREWCREGITPQIDYMHTLPATVINAWLDLRQSDLEVRVDNVADLCPGAVREMLDVQDIRSTIAVPILGDGQWLGFVAYDAVREVHHFDEADQRVLRMFAQTLVNMRLRHRAEQDYQTLFRQMLDCFALHEIICDADGKPVDYRFLAVNPAFERVLGMPADKVVGRTVKELLPDTEHRWIDIYGKVALTGEPATFEQYSSALGKHFEVTAFRPAPMQFAVIFTDISDRMLAFQVMQQSQEKLQTLTDAAFDAIFLSDQGVFLEQNRTAAELYGYSDDEIFGMHCTQMVVPEDRSLVHEKVNTHYEGRYEVRGLRKDGSTFDAEIQARMLRMGSHTVRMTAVRDITERKRAQQELLENRQFLSDLIDNSSTLVFCKDLNGKYSLVNRRWEELTGVPREQALGKSDIQVYPAHWGETYVDNDRQVLERGEAMEFEESIDTPTGQRSFISHKFPLRDANRNVTGLCGVSTEITERKRAEQAAARQSEHRHLLMKIASRYIDVPRELMEDIIALSLGELGNFVGADRAYVFTYDWDAGTASNTHEWCREGIRPMIDFVQDYPLEPIMDVIGVHRHGEALFVPCTSEIEVSSWREHLESQDIRSLLNVPMMAGGHCIGFVGFDWVRDEASEQEEARELLFLFAQMLVSFQQRKEAQTALESSEQRLSLAVEAAAQGIYDLNVQTGEADVSPAYAEMLGYDPADFRETNACWIERLHPEDREITARTYREYMAGLIPEYRLECRQRHKAGHWVWILSIGRIVERDAAGNPLRMLGVHIDVSERKAAEAKLHENELLLTEAEGIGQMGCWALNLTTSELMWSKETYRIFGVEPSVSAVTYKDFLACVHPDDRDLVDAAYSQSVYGQKEGYEIEHRIIHSATGEVRHVFERCRHERDEGGLIVRSIGIVQDITERRKAEEEIRLLASQVEQAPFAVLRTNRERRITWANAAFTELCGYTLEEVLGKKPGDVLQGVRTDPELVKLMRAKLEARESVSIETMNYHKNGTGYSVEVTIAPLHDSVGRHIGYVGFQRNIDERVHALTALRQVTGRLSQLNEQLESRVEQRTLEVRRQAAAMENSFEGIAIFLDEQCIYQNPAHRRVFGNWEPSASWLELFDEHSRQQMLAFINAGNSSWMGEAVCLRGDGSKFDAEVDLSRLEDGALVVVTRDVTYRREAERQLRELSQQLSLSLEAGQIGCWSMDVRTRAMTWDDRIYGFYELDRATCDLTYDSWCRRLAPEFAETHRARFETAVAANLPFEEQFDIITSSGKRRTLQSKAIVVFDQAGHASRIVGINYDITAMIAREKELEQVNRQLAEATRQKDQFLANMSHELRTPLNSILGMSEALQMGIYGTLAERQQHSVHRIEESGRHLLELINEILDLAKIEAGKVALAPEHIRVPELASSVMRVMEETARAKNIHLHLQLDSHASGLVGDPRRIRQILFNLLSNAIKFSHEGGNVTLATHLDRRARRLSFSVIDSGEGIPKEKLRMLFLPFTQLESTLTKRHGGTGLGLSIVKRLVELHGGTVSVESVHDKGSTFTAHFPWVPDQAPPPTRDPAPVDLPPSSGDPTHSHEVHILIVEDNADIVALLKDFLEATGYRISVARNGADGVRAASARSFDMILMDVQMPEMDGLEATRCIRRLLGHEHTPIIAITAFTMAGDRERCLAAGMSDFMAKPISMRALSQLIKNTLRKHKGDSK